VDCPRPVALADCPAYFFTSWGTTTLPLNWEAQTLRLSLFLTEPLPADQHPWQLFAGQEPPEVDERRTKESLHRQAGAWRTGLFEIRMTPLRIDAVLGTLLMSEMPAREMPRLTIGNWREELEAFCERGRELLRELRFTGNRIALGAVLLAPAATRSQAVENLGRCLTSVTVVPDRMRDLSYRVNWPVTFEGPPAMELNRITTWSVETYMMAVVQVPGHDQVFAEHNYSKLELDHNSAQRTPPEVLERPQIVDIFGQLRALAFENCERGELP
jgi:hypothetical protein